MCLVSSLVLAVFSLIIKGECMCCYDFMKGSVLEWEFWVVSNRKMNLYYLKNKRGGGYLFMDLRRILG